MRRVFWALPLLVAVLAFASGLGGGFVQDDRPAILENPAVNGALPASSLLLRTFWGTALDAPPPVYRPLASAFFRLELAVFGPSPLAFHLVSLALYLAAIAVAHRVARAWLSERAAVFALSLFAVMPLHVENVTSIVGQADLLAFGLGAVALLALLPLFEGRAVSWARASGAAAAYAAAMLCKESAVAIAAIALVVLAIVRPTGEPPRLAARRFAPLGALLLTGVAYVGVRMALVPATFDTSRVLDDVLAGAGLSSRVLLAAQLVALYTRLFVAPVDLCVGRKYAEVALPSGVDAAVLIGFALVLLAGWSTVRDVRARRAPLLLAAALSYFVFSSLAFSPPEAMADRFMLLPSFFVVMAAARAISRLRADARLLSAVAVALVLTNAALAAAYARVWRTDESLYTAAVAACPSSVHNHYRLARLLSADGHAAEAAWHFAVASVGRGAFPRPWHHPAAEAEAILPPDERVKQMHALLRVEAPERAWRAWLAATLAAQGMFAEAKLVDPKAP